MSFELLAEPIRKYIRDKRWEELRPIQNAAIQRILSTEENYILASRTASGKTEAAFLPILSKVDFSEPGVQVLYVSPLKALINDQFNRVEELCKYLDLTVTKWHGDAKQSGKQQLLKHPNGIVLITPESLEAMFANKPFNVKHLFSNLKFIVVDEIHSFIGRDRGTHLKSLISRLREVNDKRFRIIGLSATIGDYDEAKRFTGEAERTKVLVDHAAKEIDVSFRFFQENGSDLPLELLKDLYRETDDNKVLIFPNSRGRTEEVAVKLKKISDRVGGHPNYFSHHSSVDKDVREYVEFFAKTNRRENFTIACTSTLELGIDIGSVDEVVQIDATSSISSLVQRVGRSGRQDGAKSRLFLYATDGWSLLRSLACWSLYQQRFIEPPETVAKPYDILLHQALSITKGESGITVKTLIDRLQANAAFAEIDRVDIETVIEHLVEIDFLERIRGEVIIGLEGEKVVNGRDFYSVFETEVNFKVVTAGRPIGELQVSPQVIPGENILLAARIWKIVDVDHSNLKVEVTRALDGKKPIYSGGAVQIHKRIPERILEILFSDEKFDFLDEAGSAELESMRKEFAVFPIKDHSTERPYLQKEQRTEIFPFTGTKITNSIAFLQRMQGIDFRIESGSNSFEVDVPADEFPTAWMGLSRPLPEIREFLSERVERGGAFRGTSKFAKYLPVELQVRLLEQSVYDFENTASFLAGIQLIQGRETRGMAIVK